MSKHAATPVDIPESMSDYYGCLRIKVDSGVPYWRVESYGDEWGTAWQPCPPAVFRAVAIAVKAAETTSDV